MQSPIEGSAVFNGRQTLKKKRNNSPTQMVFLYLKSIDRHECGPPCKERPVAERVIQLKNEFERLFLQKLQQGLPAVSNTEDKIDLTLNANVPAQMMYRLAASKYQKM